MQQRRIKQVHRIAFDVPPILSGEMARRGCGKDLFHGGKTGRQTTTKNDRSADWPIAATTTYRNTICKLRSAEEMGDGNCSNQQTD